MTRFHRCRQAYLMAADKLPMSYPARLPCDCRVEQEKKVACQSVVCEGALCSVDDFLVEYDHLVVSVGQPPTRAPRLGYTPRDSDKRKC